MPWLLNALGSTMGLHQQQPQKPSNADAGFAAPVNCISLHLFTVVASTVVAPHSSNASKLHHIQARQLRSERFWLTATGTRRSGCRAWDDPVQGRNTALVTQYRGVRVPGGRRQLHAGVPLPHEGCAVLPTGRHLLLYWLTVAAYRWSVMVVANASMAFTLSVHTPWVQCSVSC